MGARIAKLAMVLVVAAGGSILVDAAAAASPIPADLPGIAETLSANPGSVRVDRDTVEVKPGIRWTVPSSNDEVGTKAAAVCALGWLCTWPHADFRGGHLDVQQGVYTHYQYWWYDDDGVAVYREWGSNPGYRPYSESVTSVFNNTYSVTWAPLYSPRNGTNYYALRGAPTGYVGAQWNDSFTAMCAC